MLYLFYTEWIVEVFVTGTLHNFGNDNSNLLMCYSRVGIGIVMGILYGFS